jgi:hypothetical protein
MSKQSRGQVEAPFISQTHLYRLVYVSESLIGSLDTGVEAAIRDILASSRSRNALLGITGALTFGQDHFAQVLEGAKSSVQDVFQRVVRDKRHTQVKIVEEGWIETRDFARWAMAYVGPLGAHGVVASNADLDSVIKRGSLTGEALLEMMKFLLGVKH